MTDKIETAANGRVSLGAKSLIYPEMVMVVSVYDENNKPAAMTAAWGAISDDNELFMCISSTHYTTPNILRNKEFVVSVGTKEYVTECDYLGIASAYKTPDKFDKTGFTTVKASTVNAPIIRELPFALECRLKDYDPNTGHLFAEIVNVSVDEKIMENGKISFDKFNPIVFDGDGHTYRTIGDVVGNAFSDGLKLK